MRKALFAIVAVAMLVFAGAAMAGKVGQAKPWVYDPDNTRSVVAAWTKDGLSLQKNAPTSTNASAGAEFKGVAGETMTKLSFEMKDGSYCGAGAPRFNVYTNSGTSFLGCIYGDKEDLGNGWTRVTFDGNEPFVGNAFGSTVSGVEVVMDEEGQTLLRNISVNGVTVNKF